MTYNLTASVHKGTCSSAHLGHNRRTIRVPHADKDKQHLNIKYIDMSLEDAYHILFDNALKEYNANKKPSRRIPDYLAHIREQYEKGEAKLQEARSCGASRKELARIKSSYPKPFYEVIISIGNSDAYDGAFRSGGEKEQIAVDILNEYIKNFQKRNLHLFVFSAHLHRDESGVPHIHIDYIPWTDEIGRGLPVRVSENGAFKQQGLTTGKRGDIGSVAFQSQEREALATIAKQYGINIIDGKHSKKHLEKEEYILRQEQEKSAVDRVLIDAQAGELLQYQDELLDYIRTNKIDDAFSEHIELVALKQEQAEADTRRERNKAIIATYWNDYKQFTSSFFVAYRANKGALWNEIKKARQTADYNKEHLSRLIYDITEGTDILLVKLIKLFVALFVAIKNIQYEKQLEELQQANNELKQQARKAMARSSEVSKILQSKDLYGIEKALKEYDKNLSNTTQFIYNLVHTLGIELEVNID